MQSAHYGSAAQDHRDYPDVAEFDGVKALFVAFEEADVVLFETKNLVTPGGLKHADEGLGPERRVDGDAVFHRRGLQGEGAEKIGRAEDCHSVQKVGPKVSPGGGDRLDLAEQGSVFAGLIVFGQ